VRRLSGSTPFIRECAFSARVSPYSAMHKSCLWRTPQIREIYICHLSQRQPLYHDSNCNFGLLVVSCSESAANKHAIDAQRAPVRSSSCGALLRLCEAICDYADCLCELTPAWPSRALSQEDIKLSAATFRPGRHFRLSRHRDPAPVRVYHIVLLPTGSCEQRRKHSNDPLLPYMCQFLFARLSH
jgi:hypothetical protein